MVEFVLNNIKEIIIVLIAAPGFWALLQKIVDNIQIKWFGKDKKATIDDVLTEVKSLKDNTDANTKNIEKVQEKLELVEHKTEEMSAVTARRRILRFNDEVVNNKSEEPLHSKEHWLEILRDIDDYEKYTEDHPNFKNNYATQSIKNLKDVFDYLQKEHKI